MAEPLVMFVMYTCIFGEIRDVLQPIPDGVVAHAYMDGVEQPVKHPTGWEMRPALWRHKDPRVRARRHKLLSHQLYPKATATLWLDGCLTPTHSPHSLVEDYLQEHDICLFKHRQRSCIYEEGRACIQLRKDNPAVLHGLMDRYRREGYPENNGLGETTAVLRRHSKEVCRFNEAWWSELHNNSIRDQMSFDYLIWKLGMRYSVFAGNRCESPHFSWRPHR